MWGINVELVQTHSLYFIFHLSIQHMSSSLSHPPSLVLSARRPQIYPLFSTQKWGKVVKLIKERGCGGSTDVHWDGCYWVGGIMACGPGGQRGCVGGSSYLGVHVNQRACLLRAGELRGKGSVSPASSEETRLASWLRAQIHQSGQKGTMCVRRREKGKKSVYWLTVQVVAEFREQMERNVPPVVKLNILQTLKASQYFKGAKITKWPSHSVSAGRLWELLINVKDLMILGAGAEISACENSLRLHSEQKTGSLMNFMTFTVSFTSVYSCSASGRRSSNTSDQRSGGDRFWLFSS